MNWYSVKVLYSVTVNGRPEKRDRFYRDTDFFEEKIFLIRAQDEEDAFAKTEERAKEENDEFENVYSQRVTWEYYDIIDITELYGDAEDGAELFSAVYQRDKTDTMDDILNRKYISADDEEMTVLRRK